MKTVATTRRSPHYLQTKEDEADAGREIMLSEALHTLKALATLERTADGKDIWTWEHDNGGILLPEKKAVWRAVFEFEPNAYLSWGSTRARA